MTYVDVFDTNVLLTLEGDLSELEKVGAQAQVGELENFSEVEWQVLLHDCLSVY